MDDLNSQVRKAEAQFAARKFDRAANLYKALCSRDTGVEPRWLQRLGDSLQRTGDRRGAVHAYTKAAAGYAGQGQALKAVALCKLILKVDPSHSVTQHMLARLLARPDAFRQGPPPDPARSHETPGVETSTYQPRGPELDLSPEAAVGHGGPSMSLSDDELTGPPRQPATGFEASAMTPMREALYEPEELTPPAEKAGPGSAGVRPRAAPSRPVGEEPLAPRPASRAPTPPAQPTAPARRRPLRQAVRGDVSEPAIQALPPLIPIDEFRLRDVIIDAKQVSGQSNKPSGVYHIPLREETAVAAPPRETGGVDDLIQRLPRVPLLSSLDRASLHAFIEQVQLEAYYSGEKIISQGTTGDCMYILVQGEVEVSAVERGQLLNLGRLKEGSFFGEVALVTSQKRMVSVEAKSDVMALAVTRDVASRLVRQHPQVLRALLRFVKDRLATTLSETHEIFAPFNRLERRKFMGLFKFLEAQKGANVLVQGEHSSGMNLIMAGSAEVLRNGQVLRLIGPGDIFGRTSAVAQRPSLNSVRAKSKCWLLRLDRSILRDMIMNHPKVLAALNNVPVTAPFKAFEGGAEPRDQIKLI